VDPSGLNPKSAAISAGVITNPWLSLPAAAPYVLPEDRALVERYNRGAPESYRIQLGVLPEPFLGRPDAPVVLLALNPGYSDGDPAVHASPRFAAHARANLAHAARHYPFYLLDPANDGPGRQWWRRRLKTLLEEFPEERVASALLCVEYFPYHSRRFRAAGLALPSQRYGFGLVRRALARGAVVVCMRARTLWTAAVPELGAPGRLLVLRTPQNVAVSPRNCPDGYGQIRRALATA
jgi:hypothetical protein